MCCARPGFAFWGPEIAEPLDDVGVLLACDQGDPVPCGEAHRVTSDAHQIVRDGLPCPAFTGSMFWSITRSPARAPSGPVRAGREMRLPAATCRPYSAFRAY